MTTFAEQHPAEIQVEEEQRVSRWRLEQFHQLGFDPEEAWLLSESQVDLNQARSLIAAGCPSTLALTILA